MLYRHPLNLYSVTVTLAAALAAACLGSSANAQAPAAPAAKKPAPTAAASPPPAAAPTAPQPTLLGQFGDWGAYTASPGGKKVCFALAKPASSSTNPPNRPRDPAFFFVS